MDHFKNLQNTWKGQDSSKLPDVASIKANINKIRNQLIRKNIAAIIALTCTIIVMFMILTYIDFEFITTKIAIIGIVITIAVAISFMVNIVNKMYKADELQHSSKEYLHALKQFKIKQNSFAQKGIIAYFVAIMGFMYLYFYEIYIMNATIGVIAYASTTAWVLFVWFYMRPRQIAKQEEKINMMISEVERIEGQLKGDQ